jgi:hypothetical protein
MTNELNTDGVGDDSKRTLANKEQLSSIAQMNSFQRSIAATSEFIHDVNRKIRVMFRQIRDEKEAGNKGLELFLDQLYFEHPELRGDKAAALLYARKFAKGEMERRSAIRERNEWREMQGPLAEFGDEEPFTDLPGDGDFAKAILKHERSKK